MADIPINEVKILLAKSSGRCAYTGCGKNLITISEHGAEPVFSGEIAHIISAKHKGPRGNSQTQCANKNSHKNLILFCGEHHFLVDSRPDIYTEEILLQMKKKHENRFIKWIETISLLRPETDALEKSPITAPIKNKLDKAKELVGTGNFTGAIAILEGALCDSDISNSVEAKIKVRSALAYALYQKHDEFERPEKLFREALSLTSISDIKERTKIVNDLGDLLVFSGKLDEAQSVLYLALESSRGINDSEELVSVLISISILERILGKHDSGIERLNEALKLLFQNNLIAESKDKKHNDINIAVCYVNLAQIYQETGDIQEVLVLFEKAEKLYNDSDEKFDIAKISLLRGKTYCLNADWQKAFDSYKLALKIFENIKNYEWIARSYERIARLFSKHDKIEEAFATMLRAVENIKKSDNPSEQVDYILYEADLLRLLKIKKAKNDINQKISRLKIGIPDNELDKFYLKISEELKNVDEAILEAIAEDEQINMLLNQAKDLVEKNDLSEHSIAIIVEESEKFTLQGDEEKRRSLLVGAIVLIQKQLQKSVFPKSRARFMETVGNLYMKIGDNSEALKWVNLAGDIYEKTGNVYGLAKYHGLRANFFRLQGLLNEAILEYRQSLTLLDGRSFNDLIVEMKINLASVLWKNGEFIEAKSLLDESERVCKQYRLDDYVPVIGRNRNAINKEIAAAQAPAHTLADLLLSLEQLISYNPEYAMTYLMFWYFSWQTELLALVRSGSNLSFMAITDNVETFLQFSKKYRRIADHFLMSTSTPYDVEVKIKYFPIPANWLFPKTFPFIFRKIDKAIDGEAIRNNVHNDDSKILRGIKMSGPADVLPKYILVDSKTNKKGEGTMFDIYGSCIPKEAIDLMINKSTNELIDLRTIWFPTSRSVSKDPFLTDLVIGYERGVVPLFFNQLPTSDSVIDVGSVKIPIQNSFLQNDNSKLFLKWRNKITEINSMVKKEAQAALIELSGMFIQNIENTETIFSALEIHLFEFEKDAKRVIEIVILVLDTNLSDKSA